LRTFLAPQPAAVHGDRFAFSSSLALYVHSAHSHQLLKILAQHDRHLTAVCWSPVDPNLLACATQHNVSACCGDAWAPTTTSPAPRSNSAGACCGDPRAPTTSSPAPRSNSAGACCGDPARRLTAEGRQLPAPPAALAPRPQVLKVYALDTEACLYTADLGLKDSALVKLCW
jgi:hypothetical protein